ncbi:hypothetical protein L3V79_07610 [Thiotrichales bacterium 19S9-12]|nr:hypothetical protein [Thiotrichales bacterium 19S9-11]MCF6812218.1 hypothetical protein [Thiotrichales bacterium 19S9-12]
MIKQLLKQPINISTCDQKITRVDNTLDNLSPDAIRQYYTSGRYLLEIESIASKALNYSKSLLSQQAEYQLKKTNLAAVFDIDETMLSNAEVLSKNNFVNSPNIWAHTNGITDLPEIKAVKALYEFLLSYGVNIFIITARESSTYDTTEANLAHRGYHIYEKLYLKPDEDIDQPHDDFKTKVRADIVDQGYQIILNIGDKQTDLNGGHFDQGFLLPNCFY